MRIGKVASNGGDDQIITTMVAEAHDRTCFPSNKSWPEISQYKHINACGFFLFLKLVWRKREMAWLRRWDGIKEERLKWPRAVFSYGCVSNVCITWMAQQKVYGFHETIYIVRNWWLAIRTSVVRKNAFSTPIRFYCSFELFVERVFDCQWSTHRIVLYCFVMCTCDFFWLLLAVAVVAVSNVTEWNFGDPLILTTVVLNVCMCGP